MLQYDCEINVEYIYETWNLLINFHFLIVFSCIFISSLIDMKLIALWVWALSGHPELSKTSFRFETNNLL